MITVVGEALVDLVIEPDGAVSAALGGAPFNTAIAAARLGADVDFAGTLSVARFGGLLAPRLATAGVTLAAPPSDPPTPLAAADLHDSRSPTYRLYAALPAAPSLPAADL